MLIKEFIKRAKEIHGDKYNYSKVEYVNAKTKVCIICPEHGEFWQNPSKHLQGQGCPKCARVSINNSKRLTTEFFIRKSKEIHGDKYDYSKVEYKNCLENVCIICPEHGEFWQNPSKHLQGQGCPKCAKKVFDKMSFIKASIQKHGDKYDYSKVEYKDIKTKVCIICPIHGEFWQTPGNHLQSGCFQCYGTKKLTSKEFIEKAKEIHGNKYDYSKVKYLNNHTKVCIICPEHGEFWQQPNNHLHNQGCPICNESSLEKEITSLLDNNNIKYERQKKFDWLKYKKPLSLDFYLPDYNIAIECQGRQHFEPIDYFGGEENFIKIQKRDKIKKELCLKNNIILLYY